MQTIALWDMKGEGHLKLRLGSGEAHQVMMHHHSNYDRHGLMVADSHFMESCIDQVCLAGSCRGCSVDAKLIIHAGFRIARQNNYVVGHPEPKVASRHTHNTR